MSNWADGLTKLFEVARDGFSDLEYSKVETATIAKVNADVANLSPDALSPANIQNTQATIVKNISDSLNMDMVAKNKATLKIQDYTQKALLGRQQSIINNPVGAYRSIMRHTTTENANAYIEGKQGFLKALENIERGISKGEGLLTPAENASIRDEYFGDFVGTAIEGVQDPVERLDILHAAAPYMSDEGHARVIQRFNKDGGIENIDFNTLATQLHKTARGDRPSQKDLANSPMLRFSYEAVTQNRHASPTMLQESVENIEKQLNELNGTSGLSAGEIARRLNLREQPEQFKLAIISDVLKERANYLAYSYSVDSASALLEQGLLPLRHFDYSNAASRLEAVESMGNAFDRLLNNEGVASTLMPKGYYKEYMTYLKALPYNRLTGEFDLLKGALSDSAYAAFTNQMANNNPSYGAALALHNLYPTISSDELGAAIRTTETAIKSDKVVYNRESGSALANKISVAFSENRVVGEALGTMVQDLERVGEKTISQVLEKHWNNRTLSFMPETGYKMSSAKGLASFTTAQEIVNHAVHNGSKSYQWQGVRELQEDDIRHFSLRNAGAMFHVYWDNTDIRLENERGEPLVISTRGINQSFANTRIARTRKKAHHNRGAQ